ncbi:hypothetical protein [Marinococcus sp. PL1-022]|uniref:hypothetical protein n=1 Tax=Marinococcus sp. PL1-022 TaxID=3095363 RepID=UPI0029C106A1|nr:hypothetical protein [Marinococcus sp. PL1-022]MDX6152669.1 hypothetical protein [Marinococcus sp. PL1-022]
MIKGFIPIISAACIISACASSPDYYTEQEQELPSIIDEEWTSIPLPSLENGELTRTVIQQPDEEEPERLDLYYTENKREELQSYFQDPSNRSEYEKDYQVKLLYGSCAKSVDATVKYDKDQSLGAPKFDREIMIEDTTVMFRYQENNNLSTYVFNHAQGQYSFTFNRSNVYDEKRERAEIKAFLQNN